MEILLFNLSKRKNSTKRPVDTDGVAKQVTLKGECSYINPSFFLGDVTGYTYLKAWGNYYFIDRVAYDINGAQYINCSIDVLATWKEQIKATSAFVRYSSSNYSNKIIDNRIGRITDTTVHGIEYDSIFESENVDNEFVFFITIGGEYSQTAYEGGYNYYVFTETGWNDFCALLCNSTWEVDIKKFFASVDSGLISCRRMPIKQSELPIEQVSSIRIGRVDIPYPAYKLSKRYIQKDIEMEIENYQSDFDQWSPYTRLKMYIPFIGTIDLPTDQFKDKKIITRYVVDLVTGQMDIHICHRNARNIVLALSTEVGGTLPTSVNNVNLLKVGLHGASAVTALANKNVVGAIEQAAESISAGLTDNIGNKGTFGGGRSELLETRFILFTWNWTAVSNMPNQSYLELYGKPCYQVIPLSGLTGYVETMGFAIDISAISEVKDMINQAMDKGIYLE